MNTLNATQSDRRFQAARKPRPVHYCLNCAGFGVTTRHPADYGNTTCHSCKTTNPPRIDHCDGEGNSRRQVRALNVLCPPIESIRQRNSAATDRRMNESAPAAKRRRCPHVDVIRECAAAAADFGLNFQHKEGRRRAAAKVVGHFVESCKELDAAQWRAFADEIRLWGLRWDAKSAWYDDAALRGAK